MKAPSLTIGIEEEYQIIDPETRELRSYITEILDRDHLTLGEVKPELGCRPGPNSTRRNTLVEG